MTKMPPLTLGLAVLFWAWQSGYWLIGAVAAILLEWSIRTPWRWTLADKDVNRIVDLTSLGLAAMAVYGAARGSVAEALFTILRWLPLLFLPLVSAQILSGRQGIQYRALLLSQRRSRDPAAQEEVDLTFPYIAGCLMAAGQESVTPAGYLPGLVLLVAWNLWWLRPQETKIPIWGVTVCLVGALAYVGQFGLHRLQSVMEDAAVAWLVDLFSDYTDSYRTITALGDVGALKLSHRILYRVETEQPLIEPLLLRTAAYNRYSHTSWFSPHREFFAVQPDGDGDRWQWSWGEAFREQDTSVRIGLYLDRSESILPVPTGTIGVTNLPVAYLSRHPFGAVRVGEGPSPVSYEAHFDLAAGADAPPGAADLAVPENEAPAFAAVASELGLSSLDPAEIMQRVQNHFQQRFRYTLELPGKRTGQTALEHFLLERRAGHCEYFASATVLLLRQAGLPARYAVGYSVQEQGGRRNRYLVRSSHAHAWALVWHRGQWWNFDTTPTVWYSRDTESAAVWQPLMDLLSNWYYEVLLSRQDADGLRRHLWLWGVLALLLFVLAYKLRIGKAYRHKRLHKRREREKWAATPMESIEAVFARAGYPRSRWETYGRWFKRLQCEPELIAVVQYLNQVVQLHYAMRYRRGGLSESEAQQLDELAREWLARWNSKSIGQAIGTKEQSRN